MQHYIQHPALWKYLKDGTLRSWGAKSLEESGRHGEPFLSGDGFARIGEGSGSTNMLTGSGVDEAWATGTQLGEAVVELLRAGKPFTQENLAATYENRRRASWVERGAREAQNARNGFHDGIVKGMIGMALAGLTRGQFSLGAQPPPAYKQIAAVKKTMLRAPSISRSAKWVNLIAIRRRTAPEAAAALAIADGRPLHDALLSARGWPEIPFDGRLLVTQQDALLMGGKVQAMPGFADHVVFRDPGLCIDMRREDLRRHVLRPGHHAGRGRRARLRAREVRPLRRMPVELRATRPTASTPTSSSAPVRAACTRRKTRFLDQLNYSIKEKYMANVLHIVVCAGIVPDPLQTLEPVTDPAGPGLKNEMVLPAVLDPWAACALYEAANLAAKNPGSKLWLVSLGPKAKLQQVMMTVAQKVPFELVPIDGPIGGFPDAHSTAAVLAEAIAAIPGLDRSEAAALRRLGVGHARRGRHAAARRRTPRHHRPVPGRRPDRSPRRRLFRSAGARRRRQAPGLGLRRSARRAGLGHRQSRRAAQQSANRHGQHAHHHARAAKGQSRQARRQRPAATSPSALPKQQRTTRVVKDLTPDEIAAELVEWIGAE